MIKRLWTYYTLNIEKIVIYNGMYYDILVDSKWITIKRDGPIQFISKKEIFEERYKNV